MKLKSSFTPPRRILYLNPTSDHYGVSKVLLGMLSHLPREQFQPIVILPESGNLERDLTRLKVEYHKFPLSIIRRRNVKGLGIIWLLFGIIPNSIRLIWFINNKKIDLVHTNSSVILDGAFAARIIGVSHIWHIHEILEIESPSIWEIYQRLIISFSNVIICISKATAAQFSKLSKVKVMYSGLPYLGQMEKFTIPKEFQPLRRIAQGRLTIGLVGRISPRKGQEFLIDSYASLLSRDSYSNTILFIIGDIFRGYEDYLHRLEQKVKSYDLENQIIFTDFIEETNEIYPQLDIVVVPSILPEGFGLVIVEAMSARKPVIATALGGALEIIEPDKSGLLVSPDDNQALEKSLAYLIDNPQQRLQIGEAGYRRVNELLDTSYSSDQLIETYQNLLGM